MDWLQVRGNKIVDAAGRPVNLRGVNIGGWLNSENWINGYSGVDHEWREIFALELGAERAAFFFDRMVDHFFTEADVKYIKACGATAVRIPLNYHLFEDDARPFQYLEKGFARLDRALSWCAQHGVYAILDLHAAQGYQNHDWHCDNATNHGFLWQHPHFQDRVVAFWEEVARRYADNPTVAGYNVMNEPSSGYINRVGPMIPPETPNWRLLNAVYHRAVTSIRAIDPKHIIYLDGDAYAYLFEGLQAPFADNLVYDYHWYMPPALGPGKYPGTIGGQYWDKAELRKQVMAHQGYQFAQKHNVPLWCGEFGCYLQGPPDELADRVRGMDDHLAVLEELDIHWTSFTYKDVGLMAWISLDPDSAYMRAVEPVLRAKKNLRVDMWCAYNASTADKAMRDLAAAFAEQVNQPDLNPDENYGHIAAIMLSVYASRLLLTPLARAFKGMTETQIDDALRSFRLEHCVPNGEFLAVVKKHLAAG